MRSESQWLPLETPGLRGQGLEAKGNPGYQSGAGGQDLLLPQFLESTLDAGVSQHSGGPRSHCLQTQPPQLCIPVILCIAKQAQPWVYLSDS